MSLGEIPARPPRPRRAGISLVEVMVDRREARTAAATALRGRWDARVTTTTLLAGDYVIEGRITVERKTVADLRGSLADGRLYGQAARLKRGARRPVLLVEGGDPWLTPALGARLRAALRTVAVMWYLPVLYTRDPAETAGTLVALGRCWLNDTPQSWPPPAHRVRRPRARIERMLELVPGIGPSRAHALLEQFGTLEAICNASERALADAPGVGPVVARALRALVSTPAPMRWP